MDTILRRDGYEITRDPVSGEVCLKAADYHAGRLVVDQELLDILETAVGAGPAQGPQIHPEAAPVAPTAVGSSEAVSTTKWPRKLILIFAAGLLLGILVARKRKKS